MTEAYKNGFLSKCAEYGLTEKQAFSLFGKKMESMDHSAGNDLELSKEDLNRLIRILKKRYGKTPKGKITASRPSAKANWYSIGFSDDSDRAVFHPDEWYDHDLNFVPSFKNDDDALIFEG